MYVSSMTLCLPLQVSTQSLSHQKEGKKNLVPVLSLPIIKETNLATLFLSYYKKTNRIPALDVTTYHMSVGQFLGTKGIFFIIKGGSQVQVYSTRYQTGAPFFKNKNIPVISYYFNLLMTFNKQIKIYKTFTKKLRNFIRPL